MTQEEFDRKLTEIVFKASATELLSVPGVYEAVSEHFNNEVIRQLRFEKEDREGLRCLTCGEQCYCLACGDCPACGGLMLFDSRVGERMRFRCSVCEGEWLSGKETDDVEEG